MINGKDCNMKSLPALLAIALLGLGVTACGNVSKGINPASHASSNTTAPGETHATSTTATTSLHGYLNDGDNDIIGDADNDNNHDSDNDNSEDHKPNDNGSYHDSDDDSIVGFGHAASAADKREITAVVKRYYAVAAAGDGAKACSMLASSLAEAVAEDYGYGSAGPSYLRRGKSCPAVMVLLFKHSRAQLTAVIKVTGVRVSGNHAIALLGSKTVPASDLSIQREGGVWMIGALIGSALP